MSKIIGIDLGTTNSVVSVLEGGKPVIIVNSEGNRTTPSMVAINRNKEKIVGQPAKRQAVTNAKNTVFSVKRFMGRRFNEISEDEKHLPYEVKKNDKGNVAIHIAEQDFSAEQISSMILAKLKSEAETYLGANVTEAVITVPAYFNDAQRQATKDAGEIAGLKVQRIINEPTAAALAYGIDKDQEGKIAVFDLGGGTFDISILEIGDGVFEVLSTNGDTHLGGDDFDQKLIDHLAEQFQKDTGINLKADTTALQRLKEAAEKAKKELSSTLQTEVNLPFISMSQEGPVHLTTTITRSQFESISFDLLNRLKSPCNKALQDAKLSSNDISTVILVGGMSRMPAVAQVAKDIFGDKIHKGTNPDEVVASGAAIQGGVLQGDVQDVVLLDVTPLSLGIETLGGVCTPIIERNTTIPTTKSQVFSTAQDNQTEVGIVVLQGEREMAKDNKEIGRFTLSNIPPAPRGVPQIEVTFNLDANGILNVSAKDKGTGKEQSIRIDNSGTLSKEEIDRMIRDAEEHAQEDKAKKELVSERNESENLIFQTEKSLKDLADKVPQDEQENVQKAIQSFREVLQNESSSIEEIKTAKEEFSKAVHKLTELAYKEATQNQEAASQSDSKAETEAEDVSEAEVVDEDDQK